MKKTLFYMAVAVMTALTMTSCSSDDDNNNNEDSGKSGKSALVTPKYVDQACKLTPSTPLTLGNGYSLQTIDISESGRCYFTIKNTSTNDFTCLSSNFTTDGENYAVEGKLVKGSLKISKGSRANESVKLTVTVTFTLPDGTQLQGDTGVDGAIEAIKTIPNYAGPTGDPDIISTWKVTGLIIDLKGDVNLFKIFKSGYLGSIRDEAKKQGAEFTPSEEKDFEKTVEFVTIKKDILTIDYSDGTSDSGSWSWASGQAESFNLKMLSKDMGNKFIVQDSKAGVEWQKENSLLNVKLEAKITGSKNYMAYLTMQMVQVAETK